MPFTACHTHHQPNPPTTTPAKRPHHDPHSPEDDQTASRAKKSITRQMNQTWQCTQHTTKMLASTIQISNNNPTPTPATPQVRPASAESWNRGPRHHATERAPDSSEPQQCAGPTPSQPAGSTPATPGPASQHQHDRPRMRRTRRIVDDSTSEHHHAPTTEATGTVLAARLRSGCVLLRKEVIQPHLPVRLPCYDFVPIASPTFDHSPHKLVGPWASGVADFRDVTGGVYKARERIHRSVADLRLLATPTSWGRVADPNPN